MRRALPVLLALILAAGPARAWEPSAETAEALSRGRIFLEVKPDPDGASGRIRAAIDVAAPPEAVWRVLVDCDLAPRMVRTLKSCRVLDRDPLGHWDVREHVSKPVLFVPPMRSVFRSDYDPPHGFSLHRTGGDLTVLEGSWRLIPLDGGRRTRVIYESRAAAPFAVPGALARIVLREQAAAALTALRRECQERTAAP
jgi:uncharacterized protein YndB with AHSA1/START domain